MTRPSLEGGCVLDDASLDQLIEKLLAGERRAVARLIAIVESDRRAAREVMKRVYPHTGRAMVIGITGAGGAGKSTLIGHIIRSYREQGKTVGAVLIDPSSPFSGGAFLGDRVRLDKLALDDGVYVRSMATRGSIGGLARAANDAVRIIEAMGMDVVIVETVGVGQDEVDVIQIVQTCLLVTTPGMGDDMQAMKAGVLEIADIIVLNKADLEKAEVSLKSLRLILDLATGHDGAWQPRLISTIAATPKVHDVVGLTELMAGIEAHQRYLHSGQALEWKNRQRAEQEISLIFQDQTQQHFRDALDRAGGKQEVLRSILEGDGDPYSVVKEIMDSFALVGPTEEES